MVVSGDRRCSSGQPGSRDPQRVRPSSGNSPANAQTQSSSLCPLHWHHHCFTFSPYFPSLDRLISLDSVRWGPLGLAVRARLVVRKVAGEERVLAACLPAPPCAGGDPTTRTQAAAAESWALPSFLPISLHPKLWKFQPPQGSHAINCMTKGV